MSKKRTLVILILVVGILLSLVGGAAARQEKPKFFLIAHGGPGNVFWVTVMKGMADAAAFLDVDATWLGADTASNEAMVGFGMTPWLPIPMASARPSRSGPDRGRGQACGCGGHPRHRLQHPGHPS